MSTQRQTNPSKLLPEWEYGWLSIAGARLHNLKSVDVSFPLSAFSVVTGVSGSGKSSLVEDVLFTSLSRYLSNTQLPCYGCDRITVGNSVKKVIRVDQSPIGQTPTSNAATYTGLFEHVRDLFSQQSEAKVRGFSPRRFSFNVPGGRCEKCEGAGVLKVEMHFMADVWITCDACGGKRYDPDTLEVKYNGKSIADVLDMTCEEALLFFNNEHSIRNILKTLCDVGLGYLPIGQSSPTLSGGEAQRAKLATELSRFEQGDTVYILDEPTTGLHFEDIQKLLDVLNRLVDLGNTVIVVEHNLDVVKSADWVVDIGPEAGIKGGNLVFAGTPEELVQYAKTYAQSQRNELRSYTGEALSIEFESGVFYERPVYLPSTPKAEPFKRVMIPQGEIEEKQDSKNESSENGGLRWKTEDSPSAVGKVCYWDAHIIESIVKHLSGDSFYKVSADTTNFVEIKENKKGVFWFFKAYTNDEWLLRLKFRTARRTFDKATLTKQLDLKSLNEIAEIPLFGTLPRVNVNQVGVWQEIELKVFSYDEIDLPEFWLFLDSAAESFKTQVLKLSQQGDEHVQSLMPWKIDGKKWHFSPEGLYGNGDLPCWKYEFLDEVVETLTSVDPSGKVNWNQKIAASITSAKSQAPWVLIYTKNVDWICVQFNVRKNVFDFSSLDLGDSGGEIETEDKEKDSIYIRFRNEDEWRSDKLRRLIVKAYENRVK